MHKIWLLLEFPEEWRRGIASGIDQTEDFKRTPSFELVNLIPEQERQSAGAGVMRTLPSGGQFSGVSCPRHFEFQKEDKIFIGIQAQKKGRQISELWEVAGVGLWLLFAQAVGEQSPRSSSGYCHRACFWGEGEGAP